MKKLVLSTIILLFVLVCANIANAQQVTEFKSWQDVSYLLKESAEFYGKSRGTQGTIALKSDGQKYWLYIHGVKFLPVNTVSLKPYKAVLGVIDRGKPITFSLNLSAGEKPYIMFDTQRTNNILRPDVYGWEYYEPNLVDGEPVIQMYTGDAYNGESSKPVAAKFYLVDNTVKSNNSQQSASRTKPKRGITTTPSDIVDINFFLEMKDAEWDTEVQYPEFRDNIATSLINLGYSKTDVKHDSYEGEGSEIFNYNIITYEKKLSDKDGNSLMSKVVLDEVTGYTIYFCNNEQKKKFVDSCKAFGYHKSQYGENDWMMSDDEYSAGYMHENGHCVINFYDDNAVINFGGV